jgi:Cdc6-like AAA superfamily ATPase
MAATTQPQWLKIFSPEYVPPQILFRDRQLQMLRQSIDDCLNHYYLEGPKSSGKTVTVKKFLEEASRLPNHATLYMSGDRAIMASFVKAVEKAIGRKLHYLERPFHALQDIKQEHIHLCIDDVQNVVKYKLFNPVLQQIYESSLEYGKKLHLIVVGTIIYPKFMKFIRDDVESRYRFKPILFEFYDPHEIEAILKQRLDIINIPYDEAAIKFVSAKIKRLIADLRLGFDILKNACEITKGGKITEAVIEQAWERTKTDYWKQQIRHMDEHLCILLLGASLAAQNSPDQVVSAQQILDYYRQYCWHNGIEPLYKTRLSYAFKKLDELGWLTRLTKFSKGRYGLDISYKYENNPTTIIAALKELAYDPATLEQTTVANATTKPALNTEKPQPQKSYVA